jgi:hypothetical protein
MAIALLSSPGSASILAALLDNGSPYVAPAGSPYVFSPSLVADDTLVAIAPDPAVAGQFSVTIPAGDPAASVTFTGSAVAPDGSTVTATLQIPFAPAPQKFTLTLSQTA